MSLYADEVRDFLSRTQILDKNRGPSDHGTKASIELLVVRTAGTGRYSCASLLDVADAPRLGAVADYYDEINAIIERERYQP